MVAKDSYVAGWMESSVHSILQSLPASSDSTKYALITSIDSHPNPSVLLTDSPELKRLSGVSQPLGSGLVIPTRLLQAADKSQHIFFGFDEVWLFPEEPKIARPEVSIVGPQRIQQRTLDALADWMSETGCSIGLGDGEGLNYLVKASGPVRFIIGHTLEHNLQESTTFE